MKLAIIGTAGRGPDYFDLSQKKYFEMTDIAREFIFEHKIESVISGGAAFADHIAVGLYLCQCFDELELALPTDFNIGMDKFKETENKHDIGRQANRYHREFSSMVSGLPSRSLVDIGDAIELGCKHSVTYGFLERNSIIAERATMVLAFTFGNKEYLKDGGTADTLKKFRGNYPNALAFHCDLNTMKVYSDAKTF